MSFKYYRNFFTICYKLTGKYLHLNKDHVIFLYRGNTYAYKNYIDKL